MKTVYLLRHAETGNAQSGQNDAERTLTQAGRTACATLHTYLKEQTYKPDLVLVSPALRTLETFELAVGELGKSHQIDKSLYMTTGQALFEKIQGLAATLDSVMIIGHNPAMHQLALTLLDTTKMDILKKYPPATLCVIQYEVTEWKNICKNSGILANLFTP